MVEKRDRESNPAPSDLPVLRVEPLGHWWGFKKKDSSLIKYLLKVKVLVSVNDRSNLNADFRVCLNNCIDTQGTGSTKEVSLSIWVGNAQAHTVNHCLSINLMDAKRLCSLK